MDSTVRRKGASKDSQSNASQERSPESQNAHVMHNSNLLLASMLVPMLILLAFGGKSSILTIAFGSIICYIFDLLGAIEATILTLFLSISILSITLVYECRFMLRASPLNITINVVMGVFLVYVFCVICNYFHSMRVAFDSVLSTIERVMFSTLPLVCSSLVTWCVVLEVPAVDLSMCFSVVYFCYLALLAAPRPSSFGPDLILNPSQVWLLHLTPMVVSPLLHVAVHHNVLASMVSSVSTLIASLLLPALLSLALLEYHSAYFSPQIQSHLKSYLNLYKLATFLALLECCQNNAFFSDLKTYSDFEEPVSSLILMSIFVCMSAAYYIKYNYTNPIILSIKEDITQSENSRLAVILLRCDLAENFCLIAAAFATGLLLQLQTVMLVFCVLCIRINFFFSRSSARARFRAKPLFVLGSAITAFAVVYSFATNTLGVMQVRFNWVLSMSMQQFIVVIASMVFVAVLVPSLVPNRLPVAEVLAFALGEDKTVLAKPSLAFDLAYTSFVIACTLLELLIREQTWSGVSAEEVYPAYVMLCTGALLVAPSVLLCTQDLQSLSATSVVLLSQMMKLGCFLGISSTMILSASVLVGSYLLPFVYVLSVRGVGSLLTPQKQPSRSGDDSSIKPVRSTVSSGSPVAFGMSCLITATATAAAVRLRIIHAATDAFLAQDTPLLKEAFIVAAVYLFFVAMLHMLYYPQSQTRSVVMLLSLVSAIISTESVNSFSREESLSVLISLQPKSATEHSGFFLLVSALLCFLSTSEILPIRHALTRVLFIVAFTICASMGLYGVAFSAATVHNSYEDLASWIHCLLLVLTGTSAILHLAATSGKKSSGVVVIFGAFSVVPLISLSFAYMYQYSRASLSGLQQSTSMSYAVLAFAAAGVTHIFKSGHTRNINASMVSSFSALLCMLWTLVMCFYSHYPADLLVPLSSLTLLTIPKGHFLPDTHPLATVFLVCAVWWELSGLHSVLVSGYNEEHDMENLLLMKHAPYQDVNVSIWNQNSLMLSVLNAFFLLVPLPSIIISFIRRRGESEDMVFIFSMFSTIALFGGQIWSIRMLGLIGTIYGFWWCYDLSKLQQRSDAEL